MKNSAYTIVVVVIILIIAGTGFLLFSMNNSQSTDIPTSVLNETPHPAADDRDSMVDDVVNNSDKYIQYSEGILDQYSDQRVVLFFYANWCPTCQPVDRDFQARESELPDDVVVIRVNYNDSDTDLAEEALADEYSITYQHTFVILDSGEEVAKWNGDGFERVLEEL